jgi:AcrR family transcriptional regulator
MNTRSPSPVATVHGRGNQAAIINAAVTAFATRGFYGASMREVAKLAGTSLSNLYNYFPSKELLLAEILMHASLELLTRLHQAVTDAGDDAAPRLREAVRAYVGYVVDEQQGMVVSTAEVRYLRGEARARLTAERDRIQSVFTGIVEQGVAEGAFRTPFADDSVRAILSMLNLVATWYRPDGRLSKGQLAEQYARYALALLEAPLPRH